MAQTKVGKKGFKKLSEDFRLQLARYVTADDPLVSIGAWEIEEGRRLKGWLDFPDVCDGLQSEMKRHGLDKVTVFYVCGGDHVKNIGSSFSHGVVVVPRVETD